MKKKILSLVLAVVMLIALFPTTSSADKLDQGMYSFVCVSGGRYLNVYAGWDWNGVNVCIWDGDGSPEQKFKLIDRGGHRYVLYPTSSNGRVLDANRGNSYSNPLRAGNNIDIWQTNDAPAQEWYIDDQGGGKYKIGLVSNFSLALTCDNPWGNGGNVSLQNYTGASNQLWYLKRLDVSSTSSTSNVLERYTQIAESVGNQNQSNGTRIGPCGAFCIAYVRTFLDNRTHYYSEYYDNGEAQWGKGSGSPAKKGSDAEVLSCAKAAIDGGKPAIIHVWKQYVPSHYVVAISYSNSGTSTSDFTILDPQDGKTKPLSSYNINSSRQIITF